jgi:hypothetical protein
LAIGQRRSSVRDRAQFAALTIAAELTTICTLLEQQRHGGHVLERLPTGSYAWLRPADDEPRFWIIDAGRRAMRSAELFACADD